MQVMAALFRFDIRLTVLAICISLWAIFQYPLILLALPVVVVMYGFVRFVLNLRSR